MLLLLRVFVLFRSHSKISVFLFYQFLGLFDLISFRRKTNKQLGEREREMECTRNGRWPVLVYSIDLKEKKEFKNRLSSSIYREQCAAFGFDPAKRTPKLFGQMGGGGPNVVLANLSRAAPPSLTAHRVTQHDRPQPQQKRKGYFLWKKILLFPSIDTQPAGNSCAGRPFL